MVDLEVYKGLSQQDYLQNKIQLNDFNPIESDWKELFRWVLSSDKKEDNCDSNSPEDRNIADLWKNQVLTVLVEIIQIDVERYKQILVNASYCDCYKTSDELIHKIEEWKNRLNSYIEFQMVAGKDMERHPAIQVAKSIAEQLKTVSGSDADLNIATDCKRKKADEVNYRIVTVINYIKEHGTSYLELIESSGDMDAALALLLIFIRNYATVVKRFNQSISSLPNIYYNKILMSAPLGVIQDKAGLLVTLADSCQTYALPSGTQFVAGKKADGADLIYQTEREERISGMEIKEIFSINPKVESGNTSFYKQLVGTGGTSILCNPFVENENSEDYAYGWMIESKMFSLQEGERNICISFEELFTSKPDEWRILDANSFLVFVSDASGWCLKSHKVEFVADIHLVFSITLPDVDAPLVPCKTSLHKLSSTYPIVRILLNNKKSPYTQLKKVRFKSVKIDLEVNHIHSLCLCNELGKIDVSQPFYPLGIQAELGAWFKFGNEEMQLKFPNLSEVILSGVWNRLPQGKNGYKDIYDTWYEHNNINNKSFCINCEYYNGNEWISLYEKKNPRLFQLKVIPSSKEISTEPNDGKEVLDEIAKVVFDLHTCRDILLLKNSNSTSAENQTEPQYLFRVILKSPSIGFGTEEYRNVFAEKIVAKIENKNIPLPILPLIPLLTDITLSYKAEATKCSESKNETIRLSRVSALSEYEFSPIDISNDRIEFISEKDDVHSLYIGVTNCLQKKIIRMYFDLVFIKHDIYDEDIIDNKEYPTLQWSYLKNGKWNLLESKHILVDETFGLTQQGYIEIEFSENIEEQSIRNNGLFWLGVNVKGHIEQCLPIRAIYTDYISVTALNGDGVSIPTGIIQQLKVENPKIKKIVQPFSSYDGKIAETKSRSQVRHSYRIFNRNRIVAPKDYEQLILEGFPEIKKVCCIPAGMDSSGSLVNFVVFSYTGDHYYPITSTWKLAQVREYISNYLSSSANIVVRNPIYQSIDIECIATVKHEIVEDGDTYRRIHASIYRYFAGWLQEKNLPELGKQYSFNTLYTIIANNKDVVKIFDLKVGELSLENVNEKGEKICGEHAWSVLVPRNIKIKLHLSNGGIEHSEIEINFIIG